MLLLFVLLSKGSLVELNEAGVQPGSYFLISAAVQTLPSSLLCMSSSPVLLAIGCLLANSRGEPQFGHIGMRFKYQGIILHAV